MGLMLKLPQVSLVALTGLGWRTDESINALKYSQRGIEFGEVKYVQLGSVTGIDEWSKNIDKSVLDY